MTITLTSTFIMYTHFKYAVTVCC